MPIATLVVEDDPLTRLMLRTTLEAGGLDVVAVGRAQEALAIADTRTVQVAILDVHLGIGPSGLDLAHELRRRQPGIGIVMLTSLLDPRLAGDGVVELPARARYVPKSAVTSVEMLLGVIRGVLEEVAAEDAGEPARGSGRPTRVQSAPAAPAAEGAPDPGSTGLADAAAEHASGRWSRTRNEGARGLRALTDSQMATLRLVAEGLTNAEIGVRLSVSARTVEKTLLRIARVLDLRPDESRNQRVHLAGIYFRGLGGDVGVPDPRDVPGAGPDAR